MSDKIVVHENDYQNSQAQARKKGGFIGHCKKWWWAHLIAFCVIVAILVPVIILVAVPKIAQKKIDEAQLELRGITASNSQSENFTMAIDSIIRTDGSVHANIDGFEGVMYLEDWAPQRPFVKVQFPPTTSDSYQEVKLSQFTPITDMDAFTTFNTYLLLNTSLRVTISGNTNVYVRGISRAYGVTFKKTITMPGLRLFEGTSVRDAHISVLPDARGNNFNGTTVIPNHSLVTFEIGNATFHNYMNGSEVGTVFIDNMILRPGNNSFPMRATVEQAAVLSYVTKRPSCATGVIPFQLLGKDVVNNGQHLSYYADSLAAANQTVEIDIGAALKQSLNFTVTCPN